MYSILICTDEAIQAYFVRRVLTNAGYEVAQQKLDSQEGQESALQLRPDLILLDVNLNSSRCVDRVWEILGQAECPTVLMITNAWLNGHELFTSAAATICKPFTSAELLMAVERAGAFHRGELAMHEDGVYDGTSLHGSHSHRFGQ